MNRALFLDRDGTIVQEVHYLRRVEDVKLLPGAGYALAAARRNGYLLFLVSNQAGIARGMFTEQELKLVHVALQMQLELFGVRFDDFRYCPHHPEGNVSWYARACHCRKPAPGMITDLAGKYGVDLAQSLAIGDKLTDIQAGASAGCRTVLVRTGYGEAEERKMLSSSSSVRADHVLNGIGELPALLARQD